MPLNYFSGTIWYSKGKFSVYYNSKNIIIKVGTVMKTYLKISGLNAIDVKALVALEYLDFEGKYKNYTESHDFYEICFVERGGVEITLGEKTITLSEGEIALIAPDERHSYLSKKGNESRVFVVCFSCPSPNLRLISGMKFSPDEDTAFCMKKIIEESGRNFKMNEHELLELLPSTVFGGQQCIILLTEYLIIGLLRRLFLRRGGEIVLLKKEDFYPDLAEIIVAYLKSNVKNKISLADVCAHFNYSRSFICRIFKEQTGQTLINCFNRLKTEEAKRLLCESDMPVNEISEILGFSEAKYFCNVFKSREGMTPLEYRRSKKEKEL